jgi:hypothetical protein
MVCVHSPRPLPGPPLTICSVNTGMSGGVPCGETEGHRLSLAVAGAGAGLAWGEGGGQEGPHLLREVVDDPRQRLCNDPCVACQGLGVHPGPAAGRVTPEPKVSAHQARSIQASRWLPWGSGLQGMPSPGTWASHLESGRWWRLSQGSSSTLGQTMRPKTHVHLDPLRQTLLGNRIFADGMS